MSRRFVQIINDPGDVIFLVGLLDSFDTRPCFLLLVFDNSDSMNSHRYVREIAYASSAQ